MKRKEKPFSKLLRSPYFLWPAAYFLRGCLTLLYWTLRVEVHGEKEFQTLVKKQKSDPHAPSLIVALWHNQLILIAPLLRKIIPVVKITALISKSRDGALPTYFVRTHKQVDVIRVGHQSRNIALMQTLEALKEKRIIVSTPDGPKGPRYSVKRGIIYSAIKSKSAIISLSWKASRSIRLNSWDRFCIPLPFSKITVTIGKPLFLNENSSIEDGQDAVREMLGRE
jgi:lysophospholipid acyltransferase (LPLAT)-like uncharacterized protein